MKKFGIYTQRHIVDGNFQPDETLNGFYDLSFFLNYPEYQLPTLTIKDGVIKNTNNTYFLEAEYDENLISEETINYYVDNVPDEFNLVLFDNTENAREWIRNETELVELESGYFLVREASDFMGIVQEALYLDLR